MCPSFRVRWLKGWARICGVQVMVRAVLHGPHLQSNEARAVPRTSVMYGGVCCEPLELLSAPGLVSGCAHTPRLSAASGAPMRGPLSL